MIQTTCIKKYKYKNGYIVYTLQDSTGKTVEMGSRQIKDLIKTNQIVVNNLQIDKAGRLINKRPQLDPFTLNMMQLKYENEAKQLIIDNILYNRVLSVDYEGNKIILDDNRRKQLENIKQQYKRFKINENFNIKYLVSQVLDELSKEHLSYFKVNVTSGKYIIKEVYRFYELYDRKEGITEAYILTKKYYEECVAKYGKKNVGHNIKYSLDRYKSDKYIPPKFNAEFKVIKIAKFREGYDRIYTTYKNSEEYWESTRVSNRQMNSGHNIYLNAALVNGRVIPDESSLQMIIDCTCMGPEKVKLEKAIFKLMLDEFKEKHSMDKVYPAKKLEDEYILSPNRKEQLVKILQQYDALQIPGGCIMYEIFDAVEEQLEKEGYKFENIEITDYKGKISKKRYFIYKTEEELESINKDKEAVQNKKRMLDIKS